MRILVKYPTRNRPQIFLQTLKKYIDKAVNNSQIEYIISYDGDDKSMEHIPFSDSRINIQWICGTSTSKIDACNRDIEHAITNWDILILVSDDMDCIADGWDEKIRNDFKKWYPDTDGCLWYHDGAQSFISTLSIIGKKYYDRFGYIYHPSYKSFFCDNEFTEVAKSHGKIKYIPQMLVRHQHPSWGGNMEHDELYNRNDRFWEADEENYKKRKALGFR